MIRFVAMPTEEARTFQAGGADANGQTPDRHISDGDGMPCRHCLKNIGEHRLWERNDRPA